MTRLASFAAALSVACCQDDVKTAPAKDPATVVLATPSSAAVMPLSGPEPPAPIDASKRRFRRSEPRHCDRHGIDACAYLGCSGPACLQALLDEKDPIVRRFLRRMIDAASALSQAGEPIFDWPPHSELAVLCADRGPCKQTDAAGNQLDDGYLCLTKAESMDPKDRDAAAHARACHCDWERAQIGVMGGVGPLACDGPDKPVERGTDMSVAEARDIRACAECAAERGPAACAREIDRLRGRDPDLARYLESAHLERCESE